MSRQQQQQPQQQQQQQHNRHRQWSVADFQRERAHLCKFLEGPIRAIEQGKRRILIRAPVKSGKRQMVEYLAMRDKSDQPARKHAFLTQWHRKADEDQRAELRCYGIEVLSGITGKKTENYNTIIRETLNSNSNSDGRVTLFIHIDECDHGSGIRQAMAQIWRMWREDERVTFVLYSATPEEVIYSGEIAEGGAIEDGGDGGDGGDSRAEEEPDDEMIEEFEGARFDYIPPATFCGPAKFLDAGLVFEARPFFEKVEFDAEAGAEAGAAEFRFRLTLQGKEIVADLLRAIEHDPKRNILLLRLSYGDFEANKSNTKENKAIYRFLRNIHMFPELADFQIYVDKDENPSEISPEVISEKIQWSNPRWWRGKSTGIPTIVVYDQTFSRSTEPACHDRTFATHDYRNQITFSIGSQAVERMNHYATKYASGFQLIRVYCQRKIFLLSAGRISYEEFLRTEWVKKKVPRSMRRGMRGMRGDDDEEPKLFRIQKNDHTHELHPDYPNPITETEARRVLMDLGCEKRRQQLSARVRGDIGDKIKIESRSVPCASAAEFQRLVREGGVDGRDGTRPRLNPFEIYAPTPEDPDQRFKSNIRGIRKARTVDEIKHENWGVNENTHTRRHIGYNEDGECMVLIQSYICHHEVDRLMTNGSMYIPRILDTSSSASSSSEVDTD